MAEDVPWYESVGIAITDTIGEIGAALVGEELRAGVQTAVAGGAAGATTADEYENIMGEIEERLSDEEIARNVAQGLRNIPGRSLKIFSDLAPVIATGIVGYGVVGAAAETCLIMKEGITFIIGGILIVAGNEGELIFLDRLTDIVYAVCVAETAATGILTAPQLAGGIQALLGPHIVTGGIHNTIRHSRENPYCPRSSPHKCTPLYRSDEETKILTRIITEIEIADLRSELIRLEAQGALQHDPNFLRKKLNNIKDVYYCTEGDTERSILGVSTIAEAESECQGSISETKIEYITAGEMCNNVEFVEGGEGDTLDQLKNTWEQSCNSTSSLDENGRLIHCEYTPASNIGNWMNNSLNEVARHCAPYSPDINEILPNSVKEILCENAINICDSTSLSNLDASQAFIDCSVTGFEVAETIGTMYPNPSVAIGVGGTITAGCLAAEKASASALEQCVADVQSVFCNDMPPATCTAKAGHEGQDQICAGVDLSSNNINNQYECENAGECEYTPKKPDPDYREESIKYSTKKWGVGSEGWRESGGYGWTPPEFGTTTSTDTTPDDPPPFTTKPCSEVTCQTGTENIEDKTITFYTPDTCVPSDSNTASVERWRGTETARASAECNFTPGDSTSCGPECTYTPSTLMNDVDIQTECCEVTAIKSWSRPMRIAVPCGQDWRPGKPGQAWKNREDCCCDCHVGYTGTWPHPSRPEFPVRPFRFRGKSDKIEDHPTEDKWRCMPPYCEGRNPHNGNCNDHNNAGVEACNNAYQTSDNSLCSWDIGYFIDTCEATNNKCQPGWT